jgi:uncharacterized membrane protein
VVCVKAIAVMTADVLSSVGDHFMIGLCVRPTPSAARTPPHDLSPPGNDLLMICSHWTDTELARLLARSLIEARDNGLLPHATLERASQRIEAMLDRTPKHDVRMLCPEVLSRHARLGSAGHQARLERWPNPIAAAVIGYTVSSSVLIVAALVSAQTRKQAFDRRGALWFAAVGLCNGCAVLSMYAALGRGPVALVSPLIAGYPLVTLLLSAALLKRERVDAPLMAAVTATVGGVVLLLIA